MKRIFFCTSLFIGIISTYGQVIINSTNTNNLTPKSYAGLEVISNNKGIQLPVVSITDITNKNTPILNPINGLMVFNSGTELVPEGIYIWVATKNGGNGMWSQIADESNTISSMLLQNSTSFDILDNLPIGTKASLLNNYQDYNVYINKIGAVLDNRGITLIGNSGYVITLDINISIDYSAIPNVTTSGVGGTDLYTHNYVLELRDASGKVYGTPIYTTALSRANKNDNTHSIYCNFNFSITEKEVTLFPYIYYENDSTIDGVKTNGGSYFTGTPRGNSGKITIKNINMQIEKGTLSH